VNKIFNPEIYQGAKKTTRYFEGWYFKLVSLDQKYNIAFIPGISLNQDDRHSFIQVFITANNHSGMNLKTYYIRYPAVAFKYSTQKFEVTIGENFFSAHTLKLKIEDQDLKLSGQIMLSKLNPIKKSLLSPSIMGFFAYIPKMECYHGVISMSHELKGNLTINNELINLTGGKGYLEKDWGRSFPRGYVWVQSNHFQDPTASFMFSYADIPFLGFYFKGLIANLQVAEKEYRFATYNFAKVKEESISKDRVRYILQRFNLRLEIEAVLKQTKDLPAPKDGKMNHTIKEGLMGEVHLKLFDREKLIFEDHGFSSGIEIMK
jgi:tocopherol cyclase